ncbi:MAG: hypothetical protein PHC75_01450 [Burkholderiales bacterium]|nr:hypothetical protein [Burkholderiales bacterium]
MKATIISLGDFSNFNQFHTNNINSTLDWLVNNEFDTYHDCVNNSSNTLVDTIAQLLIGSKKVRFGKYPSNHCIHAIKEIIHQKIANNEPIPILVPMGPHKTIVNENIDLAEVYALKTLSSLNSRVSKLYSKGLHIYLREEDITGWFLTGTSANVRESIEKYLANFEMLIRILKYDSFITTFRESQLVNYEDIVALINVYSNPIRNYINDTNYNYDNYQELTSYKVLMALGWKGEIPSEQRCFYRERYKRNYPNKSDFEIDEMIVDYLSISFAKSQFGALVPKHIKNDFIQLTFAPPIPGIPQDIACRRIYYRILPVNISRMHLPFWRAKGFLNLSEEEPNLAINNWDDQDKFYRHMIQLSRESDTVVLTADIIGYEMN